MVTMTLIFMLHSRLDCGRENCHPSARRAAFYNFNVVPQKPHLNIPSALTGIGAPQRGQIISIGLLTCFTFDSSCRARMLFWKSSK
jgi:hypothetical protein